MALYVAPRAVYALMDEVVPRVFKGRRVGRWIERGVFGGSFGVVATAVCPSLLPEFWTFTDGYDMIDGL